MPDGPSKFSRFWQELKRRKVIRTMTVYAATAYIIIEAGDIILPRLGLPEWTVTFIIILLIAGFPITMILSWIFDMTPGGIRKTGQTDPGKEEEIPAAKTKRRFRSSDAIIAILLVAVCILLYPRIFHKDRIERLRDEQGRVSIAVMPFLNMTSDTIWNTWQAGIQNELITNLSNSEGLSVRSFEIMKNLLGGSNEKNYASLTPADAGELSRRLEANTFIQGSIKSTGEKVRVNTLLIDSETEEIYKTFQLEGQGEEDIFTITDSLSNLIRDYLEIRILEKGVSRSFRSLITTQSPEAYRYFLQGLDLFIKPDWEASLEMFDRALKTDSLFAAAQLYKAWAYHNLGEGSRNLELLGKSRACLGQLMARIDDLPFLMQQTVKYLQSIFDKDPFAGIKCIEMILEKDPYNMFWWQQGLNYYRVNQNRKAIECLERSLELNKQWGMESKWPFSYTLTGQVYHELGDHRRENEVYEYGLSVLPGNRFIIYQQAVCAVSRGDTMVAGDLIKRYRTIRESEGVDPYWIDFSIGWIHRDAERYDEALEIFRQLLHEDPGNLQAKHQVASIIIDQEIDMEEGMRLVNELLEAEPGDWDVMYLKGLGLYKQERMEEASEILHEAWDSRPLYNHEHYQLMKEVEKTMALQN
jgi:tetratricopeptide (TPR) repeat protein